MFSGSSRRQLQQNDDGSSNVFCFSCGQYISRTFERANRALCVLCQAVTDGKELTEDAIQQYKLSKGPGRFDVNILNIPDAPIQLTGQHKKKRGFSLGSIMGDVLSAIGHFAASEGTGTEVPKSQLPSATIARQKRRPRLFSNISIADTPGSTSLGTSMEELDKDSKLNDRS
jgi:hypothetical protein